MIGNQINFSFVFPTPLIARSWTFYMKGTTYIKMQLGLVRNYCLMAVHMYKKIIALLLLMKRHELFVKP